MNNPETGRPNFLRNEPTLARTFAGVVVFSSFASVLTPVIVVLKGIKTFFDSVRRPDPSEPEGNNQNEINPKISPTDFHIVYVDANIVCVTEDSVEKVIKPLCKKYEVDLSGVFQSHLPIQGQKVIGLHVDRFRGLLARIADISGSDDSQNQINEIVKIMQGEFDNATKRAKSENPFKFPQPSIK